MADQNKITDTDLQMYIAGLFPPLKSMYMGWMLFISRDLKLRLVEIEKENTDYTEGEELSLQKKLFPFSKAKEYQNSRSISRYEFSSKRGSLKYAGALAALVIAVGLVFISNPGLEKNNQVEYTAKGLSLGMNLYVKGDKNFLVENYHQPISNSDTLQLLPVGEDAQYLVLYGWEPGAGYSRIFPFDGNQAGRVSKKSFPPSLQLNSGAENKLICITSTRPFEIKKASEILEGEKFSNISDAPSSLLLDDMYIQIYTLTSEAL